MIDAFEQNKDVDGAEQFQQVLDEYAELMDNVVSRISELKVIEELERVHKNLKAQSSHTQAPPLDTSGVNIANTWSQSTHSPIRPPQLNIIPFDGDVMKWREFWDQFEALVDKASYSPVDKLNYLKS